MLIPNLADLEMYMLATEILATASVLLVIFGGGIVSYGSILRIVCR